MLVKKLDERVASKKEFKKICSEIIKDEEIRFAGYLDSHGTLLSGGYKDSLVPRLSEEKHMSVCQELASRVEINGVLVKTGYGLGEIDYVLPQQPIKPGYIAQDLLDAVKWILREDPH